MKMKNIFVTLAGLALLGGASIGIANGQKTMKADAAQTSWYVVGTFSGVSKWTAGTGYAMTNTSGDIWVKEKLSISDGDEIKICDEDTGSWQGGWSYNNGGSVAPITTYFTAAGDGANIVCHHTGVYDITFTKNNWHILIEESAVTTHDVSFDEDGDGTADVVIPVVDGETAESYTPYIFGKVFGSWQKDGVDFDFDTPITADITLEATWTNRSGTKGYIYVITGYGVDWSSRYIYGWGSAYGYGEWKGSLVDKIKEGVTSTTNFGGGNNAYTNGGIMKVPYYVADVMTNVLLHDNGSDSERSGDLPFGAGYGYFFKNNPWDDSLNEGAGGFDETKIASVGKAAAFVYEFDALLSGKNFCTALTAAKCAEVYNAYLTAIDGDDYAKGWIDSSCINTSNGGDNVNLSTILPELRKIAVRGGQTVNDANATFELMNSNSPILIIVVISTLAVTALGGYFLLRRKQK